MKEADVLIVGAGPTALTLANWLRSAYIRDVVVLEKRTSQLRRGHAEGLKSTTLEIFDALGIGHTVWAEAWRLEEIAIWETDGLSLRRTDILPNAVKELGKVREFMLQQGRVEELLFDNLKAEKHISVHYGTMPTTIASETYSERTFGLEVCCCASGEADLQSGTTKASIEPFKARFVVGADGAHSWTRKHFKIPVNGDSKDSVFGVIDFVPDTSFPDIRKICYLRSTHGTILVVPRSNGEVRMYIPLPSTTEDLEKPDCTSEDIVRVATQVLRPYDLKVHKLAWFSTYRVRQQVAEDFSFAPKGRTPASETVPHDNVFLAGDAAHAHSPKAGQGMNSGIQDANNLGWKLRLVLEGRISPVVLDTYQTERKPVADEFIAFDQRYVQLFSEFSESFRKELLDAAKFTTGLAIQYPTSMVVWPDMRSTAALETKHHVQQVERSAQQTFQALQDRLNADLVPGKRLPDFQVVCQADGVPTFIHKRLIATGSFRLIYFIGDISQSRRAADLERIGNWLASGDHGMDKLLSNEGFDSPLVEALVIHSAPRFNVELQDLHRVFSPFVHGKGRDYWRVFADDESIHDGHGRAYERLGIDPSIGCAIAVRPDGYVGLTTDLFDFASVRGYFEGIVNGVTENSLAQLELAVQTTERSHL